MDGQHVRCEAGLGCLEGRRERQYAGLEEVICWVVSEEGRRGGWLKRDTFLKRA